ncbi:MAG TPA: hypothetical protein VGC99_17000, partial [Candidatus Tectomicrobia bacterium]
RCLRFSWVLISRVGSIQIHGRLHAWRPGDEFSHRRAQAHRTAQRWLGKLISAELPGLAGRARAMQMQAGLVDRGASADAVGRPARRLDPRAMACGAAILPRAENMAEGAGFEPARG